jgi:transposase
LRAWAIEGTNGYGAGLTRHLAATGELCRIGTLLAGKIVARVGTITRFRSAAAFAAFNGTASIEVSSGDVVRHRLSRATELLPAHHGHQPTPREHSGPGPTTSANARQARVTERPCAVSNGGCPTWSTASSSPTLAATGTEGHMGATTESCAPGPTPATGSSNKSLPGPSRPTLQHSHRDQLDTERRR